MNDIIVGVDQSDTARKAAESAAELAALCATNLHVVMCVKGKGQDVSAGGETWHIDPGSEANTFLDDLIRSLPHDRITTKVGLGDPAEILVEEANRLNARMIVVGNRRVQGVTRVLGSIALDIAKHAPCDVLIANTVGS
jgi:nucleotide-binding universal stress UspA family protein